MRRISAIAVAVLLTTISATAQQRMHSVARAGGATAPVLAPGVDLTPCLFVLNLSDAQRLQIKQIMDTEQPAVTAILDRIKTDKAALDALARVATPDACAVGTAYLKIDADNTALQTEFRLIRTKVETVLTPDQKAKLDGCLSVLANLGQKP